MTDPNIPPPGGRGGKGGLIAFLIGGVVVALALIAWVLWSGGLARPDRAPEVNVDLNLPAPTLPDAPRLPDGPPVLPPVEPPTVPSPSPAPPR